MNKKLTKISKFLSFVLRHNPQAIGLTLNSEGWALISELIEKAEGETPLTVELVEKVVAANDKNRFSISKDGNYIRANQGHSIAVDLKFSPKQPPTILYHGTALRFLDSIKRQGLKAGQRHHVHLSADVDTALKVGSRHGKPVVLEVAAGAMHQQNFDFFQSKNGVWLTRFVPERFLSAIT